MLLACRSGGKQEKMVIIGGIKPESGVGEVGSSGSG